MAIAGSSKARGKVDSTKKALKEIYNATVSVSEREGYVQQFDGIAPEETRTLFTVPEEKRFVLLKLVFKGSDKMELGCA